MKMAAGRNLVRALVLTLALAAASCSAVSANGTLTTGMSPEQAVQAMGQPDLKDNVADPNHSGATVLRYVWLDSGKVAVFNANERIASIQRIEPAQKAKAELEAENQPPAEFDPISTPLNYTFFPIKAAFMYLGAGLNCVAGGGCHKPELPSPSQG
jgi:hypothetical protein